MTAGFVAQAIGVVCADFPDFERRRIGDSETPRHRRLAGRAEFRHFRQAQHFSSDVRGIHIKLHLGPGWQSGHGAGEDAIHRWAVAVPAIVVEIEPLRLRIGGINPVPKQTERNDAVVVAAAGGELDRRTGEEGAWRGRRQFHLRRDAAIVHIAETGAGHGIGAEGRMPVLVAAP